MYQQDTFTFDLQRKKRDFKPFKIEVPLNKRKHIKLREKFSMIEMRCSEMIAFVSNITVLNWQINQDLWGNHKSSSFKCTLMLLDPWVSLSKLPSQDTLGCLWGLKIYMLICFSQRRTRLHDGWPACPSPWEYQNQSILNSRLILGGCCVSVPGTSFC